MKPDSNVLGVLQSRWIAPDQCPTTSDHALACGLSANLAYPNPHASLAGSMMVGEIRILVAEKDIHCPLNKAMLEHEV